MILGHHTPGKCEPCQATGDAWPRVSQGRDRPSPRLFADLCSKAFVIGVDCPGTAGRVLVMTFGHGSRVAQHNSGAEEKPLTFTAPVLSVRGASEPRVILTAKADTCHCPTSHHPPQTKASDKLQSCPFEVSILALFSSKVHPLPINLHEF